MDILWWHWLVLGLLLIAGELAAAGGFYIIFFGIGALIVGLAGVLGLEGPVWLELLAFALLSVGSLLLFRSRLLHWMQTDPQAPAIDTLVGEVGVVSAPLDPGGVGRIELRGTTWSARNASAVPLAGGARVRVLRVEGLMVHVGPEGGL